MPDDLSARVRALERAVSDHADPPTPLPDLAETATDLDNLTARVDTLEAAVDDLTARQQAVEAYVDRIDHVNESIERRADAALAAVDRLERSVETPLPAETRPSESGQQPTGSKFRATDSGSAEGGDVVDDAAARTQVDDPSTAPTPSLIDRLLGT